MSSNIERGYHFPRADHRALDQADALIRHSLDVGSRRALGNATTGRMDAPQGLVTRLVIDGHDVEDYAATFKDQWVANRNVVTGTYLVEQHKDRPLVAWHYPSYSAAEIDFDCVGQAYLLWLEAHQDDPSSVTELEDDRPTGDLIVTVTAPYGRAGEAYRLTTRSGESRVIEGEAHRVLGNLIDDAFSDRDLAYVNPAMLAAARGLVSEAGENPEYDRALIELIIDSTAVLSMDNHRDMVAQALGIRVHPKF